MPPALLGWSWIAVPGFLAVVAILAGLTGVVAVFAYGLRFAAGVPLFMALPLAWTAGEWIRANLPGTLAFSWLELGASLTAHPEWVGIAEVVGTRGVTFWLAMVSGLLATALIGGRRGKLVAAAAAVCAVLAVPAWGILRADSLETHEVGTVAVVQPGVHRGTGEEPSVAREAVYAALDRLTPAVSTGRPDLVILPEAPLPDTFGTPGASAAIARLAEFSDAAGAPVLVGGLHASPGTARDVRNSIVMVERSGLTDYRYDKHHLVPVVERVPLIPFPGVSEGLAGYVPGRGWSVATIRPDLVAGAFVCYESAFQDVARRLTAAGADLLVNVTNDAWFTRWPPGSGSHAVWQHPAHLVMRAIETRRGVARAASTGLSFFVDPVGRIHDRTPLGQEAVTIGRVRSASGLTLFVRTGDVAGGLSMGVTMLLLAAGFGGSWRTRRG